MDSVRTQHEPIGDLAIVETLSHKAQDLQLARGQVAQRRSRFTIAQRRLGTGGLACGAERSEVVARGRGFRRRGVGATQRAPGPAPGRAARARRRRARRLQRSGRARPRRRSEPPRGRLVPSTSPPRANCARPSRYGVPMTSAALPSSAQAAAAASSSPNSARARTSSSSAGIRLSDIDRGQPAQHAFGGVGGRLGITGRRGRACRGQSPRACGCRRARTAVGPRRSALDGLEAPRAARVRRRPFPDGLPRGR